MNTGFEGQSVSVLIVDDDMEISKVYAALVSSYGINAITAKSGSEALDLVEKQTFNLVISDLQMPKMSGLELLKEFVKRDHNIPFVILTGFGQKKHAIEALRLGAYDFLEKPLKIDDLVRMVNEGVHYDLKIKENIKNIVNSLGDGGVNVDAKTISLLAKLRLHPKKQA